MSIHSQRRGAKFDYYRSYGGGEEERHRSSGIERTEDGWAWYSKKKYKTKDGKRKRRRLTKFSETRPEAKRKKKDKIVFLRWMEKAKRKASAKGGKSYLSSSGFS